MTLLALVLAAQAGLVTQLPPPPVMLWQVRWHRQLVPPGLLEYRPAELGGPAVDALTGTVVVGTRDGWLHALDQEGRRLWDVKAGGRFDAPARIEASTAYVGSADGRLYAVELGTGKVRWSYDAGEEVGTTPAVSQGTVLVMTLQDTLVAVDAASGAWKWHHRREVREGFTIRGAAAVTLSGGLALAAYADGTVAALEVATGAVRWERKVAPKADFMDVDALRAQGSRVFAAAYSGAVLGLDSETGRQLWELRTPGAARLALGGGLLVAVTTTQVIGISPQDGSTRWTTPLQGQPAGDPIIAAGRVIVPNTKGLLWLEAASGRLLRVFDPGTGVSAGLAARGDRAYALSNAGDLFALDFR